jgi:predicted DsbA family dithiol-disulfide isomerase
MLNAHVSADVVEASEFPELSQRYQIYGVPKTVINDRVAFEGALPEERFVSAVLRALDDTGTTPSAPSAPSQDAQ